MNNTPNQPIYPTMTSSMSGPSDITTDDQLAEINEKYQEATQQIERLRAQIQSLRKQKPHSNHRILRTEFDKYSKQMDERKTTEASTPDPSSQPNPPSSDNEDKSAPKDLRKLQCKLKEVKKLSGHGNKVYGVDWNPQNSNHLVSVGRDGKLIFWNADTGYKRLAYPLDTEFIMTLAYSPDAKYVACGGLDDILSIFPVRDDVGMINDIEPSIYKAHTGYISCIQYIDNNRILTSSGDSTIREWDLNKHEEKTPTYTYRIHREDVMSISINPKHPNLLLTGSVDSTAKIVDLRIKQNNDNDDDIKTDNKLSYNGGENITASLYMGYDSDLAKKNRTTDINVVKWFPDGNSFVAGCDDGTVRLFDSRSARILNEYSYHRHYLNGGDTMDNNGNYSQENNSVVITSTNTPIRNESKNNNDDDDHKAHEPLKASDDDPDYLTDDEDPTDGVATLDFSKSGAFMFVSYNNDQHKVLAWNILTGKVVQELDHSGHVPNLSVSPDGTRLVTACWDHHLKLWG